MATETVPYLYRFTGEQWDPQLGMYYLRTPYYQPGVGRFWSMDSYEGNNSDPLSLHKYLYAHDNPVNRIDPSGNTDFVSVNFTMAFMSQVATFEGWLSKSNGNK